MIKDIQLESGLLFESIFNASPDAQFVIGKDYKIIKVNAKFSEKTNISQHQSEGNHLRKIIGQKLFDEIFKPKIDTCFHTWTNINFSTTLNINGHKLGLNLILIPIHNNLPPVESLLITAKELNGEKHFKNDLIRSDHKDENNGQQNSLTSLKPNAYTGDSKDYESKLNEIEANIYSLIENNSTLIWSIDKNYRLTFLNSNFKKAAINNYGVSLEPGMNITTCIDKETRQYWLDKYDMVFQGKPLRLDYIHDLPDNKIYTELYLNPIISKNKVIGVSAFAIDISELKQQEQVLLDLNNSLRQEIEVRKKIEKDLKFKNNELDTFIYKASHDLRGPIASLVGLYSAAKIEIKDPKAQEYLEYIHKTAQRMDQVLKALINLSEIKDKQIDISRANIRSLVCDILNVINSKGKQENITFDISVPAQLEFYTDEGLLIVMLKNLIENAIKYSKVPGEVQIEIKAILQKDTSLKLIVKDNGIGMHPQIQDKVFNMFYKGNNLSTGSGLGLYMVKSAVDKLGGKVTLKSKVNEGTRFSIILPKRNPKKD